MNSNIKLTDCHLDTNVEEADFRSKITDCGAIVTFCGIARSTTKEFEPLDSLVLETHPTLTIQSMNKITASAQTKFNVKYIHVVHRYGYILPKEAIVFVAVASAHRRAAFQAADYLMDRLKTDAVFWKREEGPFGKRWIEPTKLDRQDRDRWK